MLVNGERALAYVVTIDEIKPLPGYDRVEYARTSGWWCVISKNDELAVGDKCIYFEVDSKVPEDDERFSFLASKKYKIKTQKMCKVYSQGLLMPLSKFPELGDLPVGADVTKRLGVMYHVADDNARKANTVDKYKSMAQRQGKLFSKEPFHWLMKREWGKKLLFVFFGRKKDKPRGFPEFAKKSDEERIENMPFRIGDGRNYVISEKLDGTSCTYALKRKRFGYEFYVCSRNVRQRDENQNCYHDHNIYWDMAFKYNIKQHLKNYLNEHKDLDWIYIQGEGVGHVQGNPLKLAEDDLYIFNFVTSKEGRFNSYVAKDIVESWGMKHVPLLGMGKTQNTMEEMKEYADGMSVINPAVMREGLVYRSLDGIESFKNVSRKYLLKHNG